MLSHGKLAGNNINFLKLKSEKMNFFFITQLKKHNYIQHQKNLESAKEQSALGVYWFSELFIIPNFTMETNL